MKLTASTMKILNHWEKKLKKTLECRTPPHTSGSELIMWKWLSYKNQSVDPILFKILGLFLTNRKSSLQIDTEVQRSNIEQMLLLKMKTVGDITKSYSQHKRIMVIKVAWYLYKSIYLDHIESPNICRYPNFDKDAKNIQWRNMPSSTVVLFQCQYVEKSLIKYKIKHEIYQGHVK